MSRALIEDEDDDAALATGDGRARIRAPDVASGGAG